jgi:pimeloyl-ACP methyl ester carboxylesterase
VSTLAGRLGFRTLTYSRAGYGGSTRVPGRRVADEATVTARLADHVGAGELRILGASGGGPPALACAALLPDRVRACMVLASPTPPLEVGPEWAEWAGAELAAEFETLRGNDRDRLVPEYEAGQSDLGGLTVAAMRSRPQTTEADRAALQVTSLANPFAAGIRRGAAGTWGWFDDAVAQATDWGFSVHDIRVPVTVRHGGLDRMVDERNGRWLAASIPGARGEFVPGAGHAAICLPFAEVLEALLR